MFSMNTDTVRLIIVYINDILFLFSNKHYSYHEYIINFYNQTSNVLN